MGPFGFLLAVGAVVVGLLVRLGMRARRDAAWSEFARRNGLAHEKGAFLSGPLVTGRIDGFPLLLETFSRGAGKTRRTCTRMTVSGLGRVPSGLSLEAEGFLSSFMKSIGRGDVDTGDAPFDAAARVRGDAVIALALLDAPTRRGIEGAMARGVSLRDGELVWETRGAESDVANLEAVSREMVELAKSLSVDDSSIPGRLLANVRSDTAPVARRRCFEALLERYPGRPETAEAARLALHDPSSEMRVIAAEALPGDAGFEPLASLSLSEPTDDASRVRALRSLARRHEAARVGPVVESALASPSRAVRRAAVVAAGEMKLASALPRLVSMANAATGETAASLATAIGEIGAAEGESAALTLLGLEEPVVKIAAARALGRIGGRDAVAPLLALTGGILPFGELRTAATEAVRAIQARLGPGERGGLTLSDVLHAGGALSEPSAPEGGLSIPPAPRREPEAS